MGAALSLCLEVLSELGLLFVQTINFHLETFIFTLIVFFLVNEISLGL